MNGRLYDPKLHRFLQPDNFVQDPSNTQNYNRYGYVLNNPLKYTDPSGEAGTNPNETYPSWYNDGTVKYGVSIDAAGWERLKADFNRFAGHVGDWSRDGWNGVKNGFKEVGNWVGGWFKKGSSGPAPNMATNVNMNPYTPSGSNYFSGGIASQWSNFANVASDANIRLNHYFPANDALLNNYTTASKYAWGRYDLQGETRGMLSRQGQALSEIMKPRAAQFETAKYYAENNIAPSGNLRGGMRMAQVFKYGGRGLVFTSAVMSTYNVYNATNKGLALTREAGGWAGAYAGAAEGAAWGSLIGPWGTVIGGVIGGGIGYYVGSESAGMLYNTVNP